MSAADRASESAGQTTAAVAHTPIAIQPHAALIGVSSDWVVSHISENLPDFLGLDASILGQTLDTVLLDEAVHDMRGALNAAAGQAGMGRLMNCALVPGTLGFDMTLHEADAGYILEIEPGEEPSRIDDIGLIRGLFARVAQAPTPQDAASVAARSVRALSGFDAVAICRVGEGQQATVAAQATLSGTDALAENAFAAEDAFVSLDTQGSSNLSLIVDIEAAPVTLKAASGAQPLDLSHAINVQPSQLQAAFLRRSGAKAGFAVSLVQRGKLAGLILGQHPTPLCLGFRKRMLLGLFADLFTHEFIAKDA